MKLETFRVKSVTFIRAKTHKPLFLHCNNGQDTSTIKNYNSAVEPLLFLHGIDFIETSKVGER